MIPRIRDVLSRPALHALLALVFFAVSVWPLFAFETAFTTLAWLYGVWVVAIVTLAAVSRGEAAPESESADEPVRDGSVARGSS